MERNIRLKLCFFAFLFCGFLSLSGCMASIAQNEFFGPDDINLAEKSYGAADMLIQQSRSFVNSDTPLQIGTLRDIRDPQNETAFGRLVAGHIGSRFVQLGYNVTTMSFVPLALAGNSQITTASQPYSLTASSPQGGDKAIITGTYVVARYDVLVNLHVIEENTGRILAAYDYSLPLTSDLKALIKTPE